MSGPSILGDNGGDYYDVSITKTVSSTVLKALLNQARSYPDTYHINNYNCTNYARGLARTAGIDVENAWGYYPNFGGTTVIGGGENPGKLGQNIREMNQSGTIVDLVGGYAPNTSLGCL